MPTLIPPPKYSDYLSQKDDDYRNAQEKVLEKMLASDAIKSQTLTNNKTAVTTAEKAFRDANKKLRDAQADKVNLPAQIEAENKILTDMPNDIPGVTKKAEQQAKINNLSQRLINVDTVIATLEGTATQIGSIKNLKNTYDTAETTRAGNLKTEMEAILGVGPNQKVGRMEARFHLERLSKRTPTDIAKEKAMLEKEKADIAYRIQTMQIPPQGQNPDDLKKATYFQERAQPLVVESQHIQNRLDQLTIDSQLLLANTKYNELHTQNSIHLQQQDFVPQNIDPTAWKNVIAWHEIANDNTPTDLADTAWTIKHNQEKINNHNYDINKNKDWDILGKPPKKEESFQVEQGDCESEQDLVVIMQELYQKKEPKDWNWKAVKDETTNQLKTNEIHICGQEGQLLLHIVRNDKTGRSTIHLGESPLSQEKLAAFKDCMKERAARSAGGEPPRVTIHPDRTPEEVEKLIKIAQDAGMDVRIGRSSEQIKGDRQELLRKSDVREWFYAARPDQSVAEWRKYVEETKYGSTGSGVDKSQENYMKQQQILQEQQQQQQQQQRGGR